MILEIFDGGHLWKVVNKFDGVIVAQEYTYSKAKATARAMNASELARIAAEYPDLEPVVE